MKYCPTSTKFRNPASVSKKNLISLVVMLAKSSQSKSISVWITLSKSDEIDYLWQRVIPICRQGFRSIRAFLQLLRKDWAALQKQICDKTKSFPSRINSVSTIFHDLCFWVDNETMDLLHGKLDNHSLLIRPTFFPPYDPILLVDCLRW